jgi:hypothetical protein
MANKGDDWLKSAKEILENVPANRDRIVSFAVSMFASLYGAQSVQLESLNRRIEQCNKSIGFLSAQDLRAEQAHNAIQSAVTEIENGLLVNLRAQVAGEVLAELVGLGKEILSDRTETAKNVSAVLIAAAFEDLIRRMGKELAGVVGRPKLEEVLTALKNAGALKGGEVGTAQSYLKFRNDSLHADWANVQESQVHSCIALIETLLLKHFS